jgi:uncharacterized protein
MRKNQLIIFVRNPEIGKVKTRLAATIGDEKALAIYFQLIAHTRSISEAVQVDKALYYSNFIDREDFWDNHVFDKKLQRGNDLGDRMSNAFNEAFNNGYQSVCIIGTDCWELNQPLLDAAFQALKKYEVVIGPARDGGYYLLGMKSLHESLFKNKVWSTDAVFRDTIRDINALKLSCFTLPELNDVDEEKDLPNELTFR